jgi:hypothetical protein
VRSKICGVLSPPPKEKLVKFTLEEHNPKFFFQKSDNIGLKEIHWRQATQINGALMKTYITICEEKKRKKEKKKRLIISSKLPGQCWAVIRYRKRAPAVMKAQIS